MTSRRVLEIGGIIAGAVMIAFGIGALVMSVNARSTVSDELKRGEDRRLGRHEPDGDQGGNEGGRAREVPRPSCDVAEQEIENGRRRALLRAVHADPRARGVRRADVRADGPLRRGERPDESGRDERRGRRAEGRRGQARLERRPQHVGDRDSARDRAQRLATWRSRSRCSVWSSGSRCCSAASASSSSPSPSSGRSHEGGRHRREATAAG